MTETGGGAGGAVSPSSVAFTNGVYTGNVYVTEAGTGVTITATYGSTSSASNTFTVSHANTAASITVSPASATITAGNTETYTATATDTYGNTWSVTNSVTWSISTGAGGSWSYYPSDNVYTSATAGTWTVTANNGAGVTGTASLTVNAGALASVSVSGPSSVIAGGTATFTATGFDAEGNSLGVQTASWSITSGAAGSWSGNVYTSHTAGSWTVTGTVSGIHGTTTLTVNSGALASFTITGYPTSVTAGTSFGNNYNVVVTAYDAYGNVATNYVGSVYFTSTDAQAVLPYTSASKYTFTSGTGDDNGVHTFAGTGFTLKTVGSGSQTITVTTGTVSKTSNAITVSPGALASFTIAGYPASVTAGTSFGSNNVVVTAYDAYGNVATNYRGSVYFTSTDTQAVLPYTSTYQSYTFTAGDNGVHTFAGTGFTLKTVGSGSQTITVTTGTVSKTSNAITVKPSALYGFVFSTIATQTSGKAFTVATITAVDQYGNTVSYTGTETLEVNVGTITSSQTVTFTNGVASNVSVTITVTHQEINDYLYINGYSTTGQSGTFTIDT